MPHKPIYFCLVFLCSSIVLTHAASAEIYRWVDENGVVQFSSKAPTKRGSNAEVVKPRGLRSIGTSVTDGASADKDDAAERRDTGLKVGDEVAQVEEKKAKAAEQSAQAEEKAAEEIAKAEAAAARAEEEATLKQDNCTGAMKRVATLSRPRVNTVAEDGARTRMPEEWRQEELEKAHDLVKQWCS